MSTPAIPIDPDIVGYQSSRPTITSDFAPGDSAIDDDEEDDEHADDHLAVASAIPRRFSKRQSQGASSSEVRRLSSTTRRRDSSSAGGAAGEGSTTGRYRSSSVTTNDGGARQRKYSTGRDSLRPVNAFHIDSSILHAGEGSSSQGVDTLHAGTPSPQPPSPLDITNDDSAGTSSATSRRPSNQNHSHEFSVSAVNLSTSGSSVSTQRRPSHSAAQENGIVVHNLDKVDTKSGGSIHMPTLGETQEFDVNQQATFEVQDAANDRDTGTLSQLRSKIILAVICVAQLLDNVSMTSVNMALPAVSKELNIAQADQQWLVSAYTLSPSSLTAPNPVQHADLTWSPLLVFSLTFGGFLLLAGVLSDRYGKKLVFLSGLAWLSIWVCICGGAQSMIQLVIFRALQGLGAAATVPSAVGILTSYFSGRERVSLVFARFTRLKTDHSPSPPDIAEPLPHHLRSERSFRLRRRPYLRRSPHGRSQLALGILAKLTYRVRHRPRWLLRPSEHASGPQRVRPSVCLTSFPLPVSFPPPGADDVLPWARYLQEEEVTRLHRSGSRHVGSHPADLRPQFGRGLRLEHLLHHRDPHHRRRFARRFPAHREVRQGPDHAELPVEAEGIRGHLGRRFPGLLLVADSCASSLVLEYDVGEQSADISESLFVNRSSTTPTSRKMCFIYPHFGLPSSSFRWVCSELSLRSSLTLSNSTPSTHSDFSPCRSPSYSYGVGIGVNYIKIKTLILSGLALSFISVIPVAVMKVEQGFWASVCEFCLSNTQLLQPRSLTRVALPFAQSRAASSASLESPSSTMPFR